MTTKNQKSTSSQKIQAVATYTFLFMSLTPNQVRSGLAPIQTNSAGTENLKKYLPLNHQEQKPRHGQMFPKEQKNHAANTYSNHGPQHSMRRR